MRGLTMAASCTNVGLVLENNCLTNDNGRFLESKITDRHFTHGLTMILPGATHVPSDVNEILEEQISYTLKRLPLYRLIERPFIQAFVKKGKVHVLSKGTMLDCHDCVAIIPSGWLVLHLTKDTFLSLGLEACKQSFMQKKSEMFTVKINLLEESFHLGKKGYDKVMWCLKDRLDLIFDLYITWVPHGPEVCSSSIGIYFSDICQGVEKLDIVKATKILTSVRQPVVKVEDPKGSDGSCNYQDVFEWMGALTCEINGLSNTVPQYDSSLICPEPNTNCPRCLVVRVSGFLPSQTVLRLHKEIRCLSEKLHKNHSLPTSLTVHGFKDSPVQRKVITREFSIPGDSLYSILYFPDDKYWFLSAGES